VCALRPGIEGMSDNIRVRSLVGRFLEHSRVFYFENSGDSELYLGSADWMPRNLFERCEVVFPIRDAQIRSRLRYEILSAYLADTVKARRLEPTGDYPHVRDLVPGAPAFSAQDFFLRVAENKATAADIPPAEAPAKIAAAAKSEAKKATPRKAAARSTNGKTAAD